MRRLQLGEFLNDDLMEFAIKYSKIEETTIPPREAPFTAESMIHSTFIMPVQFIEKFTSDGYSGVASWYGNVLGENR